MRRWSTIFAKADFCRKLLLRQWAFRCRGSAAVRHYSAVSNDASVPSAFSSSSESFTASNSVAVVVYVLKRPLLGGTATCSLSSSFEVTLVDTVKGVDAAAVAATVQARLRSVADCVRCEAASVRNYKANLKNEHLLHHFFISNALEYGQVQPLLNELGATARLAITLGEEEEEEDVQGETSMTEDAAPRKVSGVRVSYAVYVTDIWDAHPLERCVGESCHQDGLLSTVVEAAMRQLQEALYTMRELHAAQVLREVDMVWQEAQHLCRRCLSDFGGQHEAPSFFSSERAGCFPAESVSPPQLVLFSHRGTRLPLMLACDIWDRCGCFNARVPLVSVISRKGTHFLQKDETRATFLPHLTMKHSYRRPEDMVMPLQTFESYCTDEPPECNQWRTVEPCKVLSIAVSYLKAASPMLAHSVVSLGLIGGSSPCAADFVGVDGRRVLATWASQTQECYYQLLHSRQRRSQQRRQGADAARCYCNAELMIPLPPLVVNRSPHSPLSLLAEVLPGEVGWRYINPVTLPFLTGVCQDVLAASEERGAATHTLNYLRFFSWIAAKTHSTKVMANGIVFDSSSAALEEFLPSMKHYGQLSENIVCDPVYLLDVDATLRGPGFGVKSACYDSELDVLKLFRSHFSDGGVSSCSSGNAGPLTTTGTHTKTREADYQFKNLVSRAFNPDHGGLTAFLRYVSQNRACVYFTVILPMPSSFFRDAGSAPPCASTTLSAYVTSCLPLQVLFAAMMRSKVHIKALRKEVGYHGNNATFSKGSCWLSLSLPLVGGSAGALMSMQFDSTIEREAYADAFLKVLSTIATLPANTALSAWTAIYQQESERQKRRMRAVASSSPFFEKWTVSQKLLAKVRARYPIMVYEIMPIKTDAISSARAEVATTRLRVYALNDELLCDTPLRPGMGMLVDFCTAMNTLVAPEAAAVVGMLPPVRDVHEGEDDDDDQDLFNGIENEAVRAGIVDLGAFPPTTYNVHSAKDGAYAQAITSTMSMQFSYMVFRDRDICQLFIDVSPTVKCVLVEMRFSSLGKRWKICLAKRFVEMRLPSVKKQIDVALRLKCALCQLEAAEQSKQLPQGGSITVSCCVQRDSNKDADGLFVATVWKHGTDLAILHQGTGPTRTAALQAILEIMGNSEATLPSTDTHRWLFDLQHQVAIKKGCVGRVWHTYSRLTHELRVLGEKKAHAHTSSSTLSGDENSDSAVVLALAHCNWNAVPMQLNTLYRNILGDMEKEEIDKIRDASSSLSFFDIITKLNRRFGLSEGEAIDIHSVSTRLSFGNWKATLEVPAHAFQFSSTCPPFTFWHKHTAKKKAIRGLLCDLLRCTYTGNA